jgi:hypothetical protein
VHRETGKELMVRVHYDEGVAIHIGPESCAGGREAVHEALIGECAGQPLSHETADIPGADAGRYAEGRTGDAPRRPRTVPPVRRSRPTRASRRLTEKAPKPRSLARLPRARAAAISSKMAVTNLYVGIRTFISVIP